MWRRAPLLGVLVAAGVLTAGVVVLVSEDRSDGRPQPIPRTVDPGRRGTPQNLDPLTEDALSFAEYLDVDVATARRYLARQDEVGLLGAYLRENLDSYGGLFLEYEPRYAIVVLSPTGDRREVAEAVRRSPYPELRAFVVVRKADWTERTLQVTADAIGDLAPNINRELTAYLTTGTIHIATETREHADRLLAAIEAADLPIPTDRIVFEVVEFAEPEYPDDAPAASPQPLDGNQGGAEAVDTIQAPGFGPAIVGLARLVVIPAAAQQLLVTERPEPLPSVGAPPDLLNFRGVTGMEAGTKGYLVLKSGCTFLESNGHDQLLAWPGGTHAALDADGTLLLLDREGGLVAREGELLAMGGGQMAKPQKYFARHEGEIPEACLRNTIWQVGMELTTPRGEYRFPLPPWIG